MKKLSSKGQKWLKSFHLLFVSAWIICGTVMLSFTFISSGLNNADHLYMLNYLTDFIDMKILVPAAMFTLLTGFLYSIFTNWGFFKYRWLIFKWIVTVAIIVIGTIFTGPWVKEMVELVKTDGMSALRNPRYIFISRSQLAVGICMNITLIFALFVSVFKPWKKKQD